ncbi:MAG: MBL fold metallo-hydrolase [Gammaproteobacteria bacterium]
MRFAILASGSSGNAMVVEAGGTSILIDCGLSVRRLEQRVADLGFSLSDLAGIAVTHEHSDHIGGVATLARRYSIPVYMTHGTRKACSFSDAHDIDIREISPHEPFCVDALTVKSAPVPHDAKEPCQFVVDYDNTRVGLLTDLGSETRHIRQHFADCDALILEFNHDTNMLSECQYPESVKRRIAGSHGHFSNRQAQDLLRKLLSDRTHHVLAAHISKRANSCDLVQDILHSSLDGSGVNWDVAHQDRVTPWITV